MYGAIKGILLQGPLDYAHLSRHSIWLLIKHLAKSDYIADLYEFLNKIGNPLTMHTLCHFVSKLIIDPKTSKLAYSVFTRIGDMQPNFNEESLQSVCTKVLLYSHPEMGVSHSEKFEYMLKCGLTPNAITYNVLLMKLLKAGDTTASWEIYKMMKEHGPEPTTYTMAILLNDAKLRRDTSAVSEILGYAKEKGLKAVHINNEILHLSSLLVEEKNMVEKQRAAAANEAPRRLAAPFEVILPFYCSHFNFQPLAHLLPGLSERF